MPPKNKKELEEEQKRLEQQQKRKEEEQAKLALERKKYAAETIKTGLMLPASNQLILEFTHQSLSFINEKLLVAIKDHYPEIAKDQNLCKLILKELSHYLKDSLELFDLQGIKSSEGHEPKLLKARVFVGIVLKLFINNHKLTGGGGKQKLGDEKLLKQLLSLHAQDGDGKQKVYVKSEIEVILKEIKRSYFDHYLILWNYDKFKKRFDQESSHIYISAPTVFHNKKDTPFIDLSEQKKHQEKV